MRSAALDSLFWKRVEAVVMKISWRYYRSKVRIGSVESKDTGLGAVNKMLYNFQM